MTSSAETGPERVGVGMGRGPIDRLILALVLVLAFGISFVMF